MQFSDRVTGICLALLGALALYGGSLQPGVPGQDVGPSVFPMVIGAGLLACGVLVAFGVGRSFEEAVTLIPAAPGQEPARPPAFGELRAFLPPALLVFYAVAAGTLGFLITGALMVLAASVTLGARPRLALPLAVLAPLAVHAIFYKLLRVPLPEGLLAPPW